MLGYCKYSTIVLMSQMQYALSRQYNPYFTKSLDMGKTSNSRQEITETSRIESATYLIKIESFMNNLTIRQFSNLFIYCLQLQPTIITKHVMIY